MTPQHIRWLHLSDLHVGMDEYAQRGMFNYITAHVRKRMDEGFTPDFIFVTGDLADKGRSSDYETFWLEFLDPLQRTLGGGISERTFVIPGNHDVDRKQAPHFDRAEMAGAKSHCFDASLEGKTLRQMIMPRFQTFVENDCTIVKGALSSNAGAFAKTIEIRGCKVGIAGINTAWLCKDNDDERKLTPGKGLVEHALSQIYHADLRIVLGHHPLDWLIPTEQKPIKSVLGQHGVLYLHGHLHDSWAEPLYGGGNEFLAVQSGAGFQVREGEKWRNGLVLAEADLVEQEVRLQPWRWTPGHQTWVHATDAFHENYRKGDWWCYPLPGTANAKRLSKSSTRTRTVQPPKGWAIADPEELRKHLTPLASEKAISFFNGAVPGWHTALSSSIPRRRIVTTLASRFQDAETASRPILTLLLAAGCEGKTTALLQAAFEIVRDKSEWRILRRTDDSEPLAPADILPVISMQRRWLIVLDEADRVAKDVFTFIPKIPSEIKDRVHFLIACRDSDWISVGAHEYEWHSLCAYKQERLTGLQSEDTEAIVGAWAAFGDSGLGDLSKIPEAQRAKVLGEQAREEAKISNGAFFGALLAVRHGNDLRNHGRLMLERLVQRPIPSGGTLRDALTYIAAMHAEGFEFLSRPVLAKALNCPLEKLHRDVLAPLGQEAAATTTSSFIYTRHRRIAQALVGILEQDYFQDIAQAFVQLGTSAIEVLKSGRHLPENPSEWRFRFAEHFFDSGRIDLALTIGEALLRSQPSNTQNLVNLAKLYRDAQTPEKAVELFRTHPTSVLMHRGFYGEWSTAEALCEDRVASTLLGAFSLSDDCATQRVNNKDAINGLSGLCVNFAELYGAYRSSAFRDALISVAVLGCQLVLDKRAEAHFLRYHQEGVEIGAKPPTVEEAVTLFRQGVAITEAIGVHDAIASIVPDAAHLDFGGLQRLIYDSAETNE